MSAPEPDDTGTWSISEAASFRLELLVACSERTVPINGADAARHAV
jgi:hypothetical protein